MYKLDFNKIKIFCAVNDNIKKLKRQPPKQKIFVTHLFDKELVSRLYKEHLQLNKKINNPIF